MKKPVLVMSSILLLSLPLSTYAKGNTESDMVKQDVSVASVTKDNFYDYPITKDFYSENETLNEPTLLYSGPVGGDEDLKKPFNFTEKDDGGYSTNVVVNDGASFTWEFERTNTGSDKLVKNGYTWMRDLLLLFPAAKGSYALVNLFTKDESRYIAGFIAGGIWKKGTSSLPQNQYTYWTVHRYVDKDYYNVYHKYVVYMYTDKAKTKLKSSFTEVHSDRYR